MPKYRLANVHGLVSLQYQPEQVAFLKALAERHCPAHHRWSVTWGDPATLLCPICGVKGRRDYDRMLLYAGRQSGKSRIGTLASVLEATFPDTYHWVTAPTYRDLTDFVEPSFFAQLPQDWLDRGEWSVSDRLLTLPNGTRVAFRSLEDPQSARGPTLDSWLMDEACQVSGVAHDVGDAMLAIKGGVEILTTTPLGEDWVFEKVWMPAEAHVPGFWAATWKTIDNPLMATPEGIAYINDKRATMSPEMFAREYEASTVTFQGAIYGTLIDPCLIDDLTEPGLAELKRYLPEWPAINPTRSAVVGLDPGSDHPFAGVPIVVGDKALVIFGEYLARELPAVQHAQHLKALVGSLQPRWGIDRSQAQMITELAQHGIFSAGADNAVIAGIERVKSWMVSGQLKFVKSRTRQLVSQLKSYRWKDTDKRDGSVGVQEVYKRHDDLPDALRYGLCTWPHLPEVAAETVGGRDVSQLPEAMQRDILRFRQHAEAIETTTVEGVGDFFGDAETYAGEMDSFYG